MAVDPTQLQEIARKAARTTNIEIAPTPAEPPESDKQMFADAMATAEVRPEKGMIKTVVQTEQSIQSTMNVDPSRFGPIEAMTLLKQANHVDFTIQFWAKLASGLTQGITKLTSIS